MNPVYFREGRHYSFAQLEKAFSCDKEKTRKNIGTLKKYNLLKTVRNDKPEYSDLSDQDIVIGETPDDSSEFSYIFSFVGVILLDDLVLLCYPKYIDNDEEPFEKLKTVIKVIEKYNQKEQLVHLYNGEDESKQFNRLAISLHILHDYFENGLYSNQEEVVERNGEGEILWDKTINETFAFIKNNTPYYLDLYTHDNTQNDFDFIRRLHAAIVSTCSRELNNERLLDLFTLSEAELTEETIEDFGDVDYIKYRLEREIKNQFVTRKQNLLKTLYTYVSEQSSNQSDESFSLYGTNAFNLVWETACGEMFENMKSEPLKNLARCELIPMKENSSGSLADYIEIPEWIIDGQKVSYKGDLIPDIVTFRKEKSGNTAMYILDGKYYLLSVSDGKLFGNPGIQDVVKQYVYNASLKSFIDTFQIGEIANAFLIPALESENAENQNYGEVPYWTAQHSPFNELPSVQVIKLQAQKVWDFYLGTQTDNAPIFNLIQKSPTKNYLYHNENDNSIIQINDGKKHILVGFMREDYFNHIDEYLDKNQKENNFLFFFYSTGIEKKTSKFIRYPLHPYIDSCTEIIIYTKDKSRFIQGKLLLTKTGRCKIDELTAKDVENELKKPPCSFIKKSSNARTYYVMTVGSARKSTEPYTNICNYGELAKKIKENGLNDVLYNSSPKVIDV